MKTLTLWTEKTPSTLLFEIVHLSSGKFVAQRKSTGDLLAGKDFANFLMTHLNTQIDRSVGPHRFNLVRHQDVTGISGDGIIAEGVQFSDGQVAFEWIKHGTIGFYPNIKSVEEIHGHQGATEVVWL